MADLAKTKEELLREITLLREKVTGLESACAQSAQAEDALRMALVSSREEKARVEAIVSAMGDPVSIQDTEFRVLYQNEAHKKLVGDRAGEYCYKAYNNLDSVCEKCPVALCFGDGGIHTIEKDGARHRGILRVEITASPLRDENGRIVAGIEVVRNTTQRRRAEEALRAAEAKFRTLVEQSITGIYIIQDARLVYANPRCAEIFGYTVAEALSSSSIWDFVHEDDRAMVGENISRRLNGEINSLHYTFRGLRKDGTEIEIETHGSATVYEGRPAIMGTLIDISGRKRLEKELTRAQRLESFGILAGFMAHQFNNILTALSGNIILAKMYAKPESEVFDILTEAEKAAGRAEGLTRRLLAFSKDRGVNRTVITARALLENFLMTYPREGQVRFDVRVSDAAWPVEVDEVLLHEALRNIVDNACQAMPSGGTVTLTADNISLDEDSSLPLRSGRYVRFTVSDQGPGIASTELDRIFEPFFTTRKNGIGLGLTSSCSIVRDLHGHVTAESGEGVGTSFHIFLPAAETEPRARTAKCTAFPRTTRILVMDDEDMIRTVMDRMLTQCGCVADFSRNGEEMLQLYRKSLDSGRPYDAVILDVIVTEGMGGAEAIRLLIEMDPGARAIVTSGHSHSPAMTSYREFGFRAALAKPYTIAELCNSLHSAISSGP